jgi:hypothetical protein
MFTESDSYPIFILTDDTGMIQHSNFAVPDPKSGYTTDDNARALIASILLYEKYRTNKYLNLILRYLSFLTYAQNKNGGFRNFMDYDRHFLEENGSEDCFGRCLWCLGFTINSNYIDENIKYSAFKLIKNALNNIGTLTSIRGKSYSLIGLCLIYNSLCKTNINQSTSSKNKLISIKETIKKYIIEISNWLVEKFLNNSDDSWKWFEDKLTYANSIIPLSLFRSYGITGKKDYYSIAINSLKFLDKIYFKDGFFKPIGCKGWYKKGDPYPAKFDEQPIEACGSAILYKEAYNLTKDTFYKERALLCYEWFTGNNSINKPIINKLTNSCYDGITESKINLNSGAESILAKIITQLIIEI